MNNISSLIMALMIATACWSQDQIEEIKITDIVKSAIEINANIPKDLSEEDGRILSVGGSVEITNGKANLKYLCNIMIEGLTSGSIGDVMKIDYKAGISHVDVNGRNAADIQAVITAYRRMPGSEYVVIIPFKFSCVVSDDGKYKYDKVKAEKDIVVLKVN